MTPEIISFAFGVLLILIGILGGGFEVRKLKIPKVGPGGRILAAVGGLSCITLGIGIQSRGTTPEKASSSPVNFTISDVLGDEQVSGPRVVHHSSSQICLGVSRKDLSL